MLDTLPILHSNPESRIPNPGYIVSPMAHGSTAATAGIGFGTALAITISWSVNKSILWAIIHGIFSWFYVIYFALFK